MLEKAGGVLVALDDKKVHHQFAEVRAESVKDPLKKTHNNSNIIKRQIMKIKNKIKWGWR